MEVLNILSLLAGIVGTITGTCGLILSILNFTRDKPNIQVVLIWDMSSLGLATTQYDEKKSWGVVSITNVGRRPIFFSHLHLEIPGMKEYLLINEGISGEKLLEGDPPKKYPVTQDGLQQYSKHWDRIKAVVIDSTGKKYYSLPVREKPSWANI